MPLQNLNDPRVSVLIPAYNAGEFIRPAIESILAQTYQSYEIIVVDDGSTDHTWEVLKPLQERNGMRLFRQTNMGAAAARNKGLAEARGEFIAFCDSDDLYVPEKLELQIRYLEEHPDCGLVYSDLLAFCGDEILCPSYFAERRPCQGWVFEKLIERNFITNVSVMVRRKCLDEVGGFNASFRTSEDYELWLRFTRKFQVGYIPQVLVKVRRHSENLTSNEQHVCENHLKVLDSIRKACPDVAPKTIHKALAGTFWGMGYDSFTRGDYTKARADFIKSYKSYPSLRAMKYLLALMMPDALLSRVLPYLKKGAALERRIPTP